jgi:primosomal protein N' (replication factor Y) (superfamily II helicase)
VLGAPGVPDALTYTVPDALDGAVQPGHRVLVPVRSRKLTGVVVEIGEKLDSGGVASRPIFEVLEPTPLYDRAHLDLLKFVASYYLVSTADAFRSVVPTVARVESRRMFALAREPAALELAGLNALERKVLGALTNRAMTERQLARLGEHREVASSLNRLIAEGIVETRDATRGRHREACKAIVRLKLQPEAKPSRGSTQRAILGLLAQCEERSLGIAELEAKIPNAKPALKALTNRGLIEIIDAPACGVESDLGVGHEPNQEQVEAISPVAAAIEKRRAETFLLWGVTASGKTEVYLQLAARCLDSSRQALVMVPEIALADQVVNAFRNRFGDTVAIAHSGQTVVERWASWRAALSGRSRIMVGPRSAIFAPIRDLGLVVVDEEHDPAYKQEEGIRYNARDLAVALGKFSDCSVVLGSATPSAESFANARRGRYRMLQLSRRVMDRPMAEVRVIDLREEMRRRQSRDGRPAAAPSAFGSGEAAQGRSSEVPLSQELIAALRENLKSGGQSLVFLNRRGYHNFLQCHLCGSVITCPNCSVAMTFHLRDRSLRCHYCGHHSGAPDSCPACGGLGLAGQGFGTERLVAALQDLLPEARIERMDSDTSGRKGARSAIVGAVLRGDVDILVGTQMVTKGFDLPNVTLVGVVLADLALNMPDFRSAERTFQLLTQVAGRAGRGERAGLVLIQTYSPNHYSIRASRDQDFARFMRRELNLRRELRYPPYARTAMVRIEGEEPRRVAEIAAKAATSIARVSRPDVIRVLGPAPAPIERLKQRYRWQVMVKSAQLSPMREALVRMRSEIAPVAERSNVRLLIDIDPVNML